MAAKRTDASAWLAAAPREEFSAADRALLADLARQVGAAVHTEGLAAALQRSRERLVLAREEERRRVGRDLHDGIGPQLAALSMTVETARDLVAVDPSRAEQLLTDLLTRTEQAVTEVRHEIRQPRPSFFIWLTNLPIIPRAR
jgi:signal transduction histidine kinase